MYTHNIYNTAATTALYSETKWPMRKETKFLRTEEIEQKIS